MRMWLLPSGEVEEATDVYTGTICTCMAAE